LAARKAVEQNLTREMILEAARELFVKQGYQSTSMRQVAKVLNYSHGAIYYHFKNKAELYYALVKKDFTLLNQKLAEVINEEGEPQTKLERILLGFIEFGLNNQSHYEIMFQIKDKELQHHFEQEPILSYERFAQAIFSLYPKQVSPAIIWSIFLSLHGFVTHYCKSGQSYEDVKELAKSHVQFIMKAFL
jgi:AcrR family transcriptional regulator